MGKDKSLDWKKVSAALIAEANKQSVNAGLAPLTLEETLVYASYEHGRDAALRRFLTNFLDRQPGVRVFTRERKWRQKAVHCRTCNSELTNCPSCKAMLGRASEKAIDSLLVTDLMNLAWEGAYDVALLVSSDGDFIPAVSQLQSKNFKVINAAWNGIGHELAKVCWASFNIDGLTKYLVRTPPAT